MHKVTIKGNEITLHEFNGRKALRAAKIVRSVGESWPEILRAVAEFRAEYEEHNAVVMDRATARHRFPLVPILDDDQQRTGPNGELLYYDRLGHLTEADWEASGQKLRIPQSPSKEEVFAAAFPIAFDKAEEQVLQLLALCTIDADDMGKAAREGGPEAVTELLHDEAERLLDNANLGELMELAVVGSEMVERQVQEKLDALGDRVGNLLRLVGLKKPDQPTPIDESSTTKPPSSTSSPANTAGENGGSSTALAGASSAPSSDA